MEQCVLSNELSPGIVQLTINRVSSLNALNPEVLRELYVECEAIRDEFYKAKREGSFAEDTTRVVIITGSGDRAFVAGADIPTLSGEHGLEFLKLGVGLMELIESLPVPVIAKVDGFCLGGGLELALACDLIISSERSRFGLPEVSLSLIPGFGGTQRLPRRVGMGEARRMILTGEMLSATEARRIGLIDVLADNLSEIVLKTAKTLAGRSPLALEAAKLSLQAADNLSKGLAEEERIFSGLLRSMDAKEGLSAFLEKREPKFTGK
jgi:enoyl-CoA hydratase